MNSQAIGWLLVIGGGAWFLLGDKIKLAASQTQEKKDDSELPSVGTGASNLIGSRVDAVAHCERLMQFFESQDNKTGAECMRTAISSIYAPKE